MRNPLFGAALGALLLVPQLAAAEDAALILLESDYRELPDVGGEDEAAALARALEAAGFRVISSRDQGAEDAWTKVADWRRAAAGADRLLVFASGHMVSGAREAWLLTRYAQDPSDLSVGAQAVPLGPVLDTLATKPGQAVLMLAPSGKKIDGQGLVPGAAPEAPQGVTVLSGSPKALLVAAQNVLLAPGAAPARGLTGLRGVEVSGFVSDAAPFVATPNGVPTAPQPVADPEVSFWNAVRGIDSAESYQSYLDRYPNGRFVVEAKAGMAALEQDAQAQLAAGEAALGLDAEARKKVQRNLVLLGYDPRGIDGVFGPGSRAAIAAWQKAQPVEATGYLTAADLRALTAQGQAEAARLEAEAAARRAEQERQDRLYWDQVGKAGDEAGLRAYLGRYPDGLYADVARARLAEIEAAKRAETQGEERALWDNVRDKDTIAAYRRYLNRYPEGRFVDEATARIDALQAAAAEQAGVDAAKTEEDRVAGNQVTRLLVETRLASLGFDPGRVDGTFDATSRKAIRQFQRARGIAVTGYVSQETMVHLMSIR